MVLGELLIRPLLKWLLGIEKEAEKRMSPEDFEEYMAMKSVEELEKRLKEAGRKAWEEIKRLAEETQDPVIKGFVERQKKWEEDWPSDNLALLAILEAFKQDLHKDPELFGAFLLHKLVEYYKALWDVIRFPHAHPRPIYHTFITPGKLSLSMRSILSDIYYPELEKSRKAEEILEEFEEALPKHMDDENRWFDYTDEFKQRLDEYFWEVWKKRFKERPEELFGTKEEEEEKVAPKIWAVALAERLPSASYRIASILQAHEAGAPLPKGFLQTYLHTTTHPTSPQGTALYNLVHHYLQHLEEHVARGEKPPEPTTIIKDILRKALHLRPYHDPLQTLKKIEEGRAPAEARLLKARLGIPLKPREAARALRLLIHHLHRLEKGEEDPHTLDAKLELSALSKSIPAEPGKPDPSWKRERLRGRTLRTIFREAAEKFTREAQQFGREEDIALLAKAVSHAAELLDQADHAKPYHQVVGEIHRQVREKLTREGHHPEDATWASNVIQHLLLTLPIHAVEEPGDVAKAKAVLVEGFEPREYDTAPLVRGLYEIHRSVSQLPLEDAKSYIARRRNALNSLEALKGSVSRVLEAHRQEGVEEPKELAISVHETIKSLSRSKPRIRER